MPPLTAVMAWVGFGETLAALTIAGMVLTATGVALVAGPPAPDPPRVRNPSRSQLGRSD